MNHPGRPRARFVGITFAGWQTRQENLERHVAADGRLAADFHHITGWKEGGLVERLPLPGGVRGRLRSLAQARRLAAFPRPDILWTTCAELALPYLWSQAGRWRRPIVFETDWTLAQQEALAPIYFGRPPREGLSRRFAGWREQRVYDGIALFTPISNWAADGLRRAGVEDARIRVLHPGVDLDLWEAPARAAAGDRPLRLLFVGGDFARKGGHILLDVFRERFQGRCELDIVTRTPPPDVPPGVRIHQAGPNSPLLRSLYRDADLFVFPTRAEAFGHVSVEAMASGLPAIISNVGGAPDIVEDGVTGWLIDPEAASLAAAIERALARRAELPAMGRRGRLRAERLFDGAANDRVLVDLMIELHEERLRAHESRLVPLRPSDVRES